jgi:hypothetical protein
MGCRRRPAGGSRDHSSRRQFRISADIWGRPTSEDLCKSRHSGGAVIVPRTQMSDLVIWILSKAIQRHDHEPSRQLEWRLASTLGRVIFWVGDFPVLTRNRTRMLN